MPSMSKMKAQSLLSRFEGRITTTRAAETEFGEGTMVFVPDTAQDVGRAIALGQAAGRRVFLRSGEQSLESAGALRAAEFDPPAPLAVVSLAAFDSVSVELAADQTYIRVGPAATLGDLASMLEHRAIFLPLEDLPSRSVASALLSERRPPFPRSGPASLRQGVVEATAVATQGAAQGRIQKLDSAEWTELLARGGGVVTELVIDASGWAALADDRWARVWMMPYTREHYAALCESLLGRRAPARVDLSVRASKGAYGETLIVVRATGQERHSSEAARSFVLRGVRDAKSQVLWSEKVEGSGSTIAAWVAAGPGRMDDGRRYTEAVSYLPAWSGGDELLDAIDALVREGGWVDLQLASRGRDLVCRALAPSDVDLPAALTPSPPEPAALDPMVGSWLLKAVAQPDPNAQLDLEALAPPSPIPGFRGAVFQRAKDDAGYRAAIGQYASSSYDSATIQRRMSPKLVAFPVDASDVLVAIQYAADHGLAVVARSGGHQYCGLSSGGDDTVLVDMSLLADIVMSADGARVTVGPGGALQCLTAVLVKNRVAIPHGECPLVKLGGHVQTGGVGHQLRSLGLALDWVAELRMIVCDAAGRCTEQTYARPQAGAQDAQAELFRAALGGGPGSWGVLTSMTFDVVKDDAHQASIGRTRVYPYDRSGWFAALDQMRLWSERESARTLPSGIDLFVSAISGELGLRPHVVIRPAVLMLETTSLDPANDHEIVAVIDSVAAKVSWLDRVGGFALNLAMGAPNGPTPLSKIVDKGVRSTSALGGMPGGREFSLPYKKSLYVTRDPLSKDFCARFADLVDRVESSKGTSVVFQGVVGGGRFQENGGNGASHMQHRDALLQLVFDVFYDKGFEQAAEAFQAEMRALWAESFPGERGRMFWGTFEDPDTNGSQLDMSVEDTQRRYYDTPAGYAALQAIKRDADPKNVFRTSFTVQP